MFSQSVQLNQTFFIFYQCLTGQTSYNNVSLFFYRCCSVAARSQQLSSRAQKACSLHQDATKGTGKKSMQQASLSPKTRDDASLRQPTSQNAKLLFGSRTAEWRRRSLSVNPRLIITCILDVCFELFFAGLYPSVQTPRYLCSEIMNEEHPGSLTPVFFHFI